MGRFAHSLWASSAAIALLIVAPTSSAWADQAQLTQAANPSFNITAQPLASALTEFGLQAGLQIAVDSATIQGLRSPGVQGPQTAEQALDTLLSGTGMSWRFVSGSMVVVEPAVTSSTNAGGAMVLGPITVFGERVTRTLNETASSVSVVDRQTIESRPDLASASSVLENTPNVVSIEPGNYAPIVRGMDGSGPAIGANAFFAGVRPRLTMQIDGRPTSFNEMIFGTASMWDVEQMETFRGPQSTVQGRNSIAGAIVIKTNDPTYEPEAKARIILGNHESRQASVMFSGPIIKDQLAVRLAVDRSTSRSEVSFQPYEGEDDPEDYQSTNVRAKFLIEPVKLEGFSSMLTLNYTNAEGPQGEYVLRPFGAGLAQSPQVATFNPRTFSGILESTWDINDSLMLQNRIAATDFTVLRHAPPNRGNVRIDGREYMLEPRLHFSGLDDRLNGFGGYYGLRSKQREYIDMAGGNNYIDKTMTHAVFGEATYSLSDQVDLTAGARYEEESRQRYGGVGSFGVSFNEDYKVFMPKLGAAWHINPETTVGATVSRGYNGGGAGVTFSAPFTAYSYDPEYVWNYETYGRINLMDGALQLTGNLFYADYKDLQLPFTLAAGSTVIRNAEQAATYGAEIGSRWRVTPELELSGDIGLLKTEILSYPGSGYEGNELAHAPALTGSVGAVYRPIKGLELGGDIRYSEAYYSDTANSARGKVDPYTVTNIHASYDLGGSRVFGYVNNLFDVETPLDIGLGATESADYATMLKPLTFGVGVEVAF
jgi:outer membrane receptor protein involved in Fe transport